MSVSDTSISSLGFAQYLGSKHGGAFVQAVKALGPAAYQDIRTGAQTAAQGAQYAKQGVQAIGQHMSGTIKKSPVKTGFNIVFFFLMLIALILSGVFYMKVNDSVCPTSDADKAEREKNYKVASISLGVSAAIFLIVMLVNFFWTGCSIVE